MDKIKKKVVVVGDPGVGKSAMVQTYCSDGQQLSKDYVITLVADISSKIIEKDDETDIELFFFDVSGREMLRSAVQTMVRSLSPDQRRTARRLRLRLHQ
jgi:intraflagellar transport protein 27